MDDRLNVAVKEAFVRLYEQGLIYRGSYIVNWDPRSSRPPSPTSKSRTRNASASSTTSAIRLPDGTGSIVVATTRPETMLGDTAVAVNPNDERYTAIIGKLVALPLSGVDGGPNREIPILADDWAQPEFGTGAVKVTPAHDPNDFAIGQRHALPSLTILDRPRTSLFPARPTTASTASLRAKRSSPTSKPPACSLTSRTTTSPSHSRSAPAPSSSRASPCSGSSPSTKHRRSGGFSPLNARAQEAGFSPGGVARDSITATAIAAVRDGHIKFTPEMYQKIYMEWMTNIHDWCISRQLWWGHRIPGLALRGLPRHHRCARDSRRLRHLRGCNHHPGNRRARHLVLLRPAALHRLRLAGRCREGLSF